MAVITELIDVGIQLKAAGNLQGAIEHFRQLHRTYPEHARIMFELAACWRAFGVPERALPLYRELLEQPKSQGLPPKDMPRLYTHLGATLRAMGELEESLAVIEEGLRLHPTYRPLRAWRIFALYSAGSESAALLDAVELMLESLAPSRWDIFEDDISAIAREMRAAIHGVDEAAEAAADKKRRKRRSKRAAIAELIAPKAKAKDSKEGETKAAIPAKSPPAEAAQAAQIAVDADAAEAEDDFEVAVTHKQPAPKKARSRKKPGAAQLGKKAVRINIGSAGEDEGAADDGEDADAAAASFKIPIDND